LPLPDGQQFSELASEVVAMSPDGSTVVFVVNNQLYRRNIGEQEAQAIPGGYVDALLNHPVFAPDGGSLVFFSAADGTLKRLPIGGGTPVTIAPARNPFRMSWGDGGILFDDRLNRIFRVPASGGTPQELIAVRASERVLGPQILPGGDAVLFTLRDANDGSWDTGQIVVQSLSSGVRKTVIMGGTDGRYLPSGHLVYAVAGSLFAIGFDATTRMTVGSAVRILTGVRRAVGTAMFSVSNTGSLVYVPGPATTNSSLRSLVQSDRNGVSVALKVRPDNYVHPRVSRDGSTLAVGIEDEQAANIWIYELAGTSTMRKLTSEGRNRYPVWSGDGPRIAFQSDREGDRAIFWQPADGAAAAIRLTTPSQGAAHVPESWSADGKHMLYAEHKDDTYKLFSLSLADMTSAPFSKVQSTQPTGAGFSPDGRWIAYAAAAQVGGIRSPDRGIFIEPFPATRAKHPVPKMGIDFHPAWSSDGKEIMYVSAVAQPLVAISVRTQPSVSFGSPSPVSPAVPRPGVTSTDVRGRGYDVLPGGKILTLAPVATTGRAVAAPRPEIRVVLNWQEELKRLVPTN
jgi:Tol biopolymer transport system component